MPANTPGMPMQVGAKAIILETGERLQISF